MSLSTIAAMQRPWIKDRLRELRPYGKSQKGLAELLGLDPPRVSDMIAGERDVKVKEIPAMAHYLEWPEPILLAKLTGGQVESARLGVVQVIGTVQAGLWREALEWAPEDWYPAPVAVDSRYAHVRQFGLEIHGPSMNEIYPHGTVVVCVKLIDLGVDAKPGQRVVCQRRSDLGFEATVKELRQDAEGKFWLWPRSTDPNFQQPWRLPSHDGESQDPNEDVRIVALVIGSYRPEA